MELSSKSLAQALKNRPLTENNLNDRGIKEHESGNMRKSESGYAVGCIGVEGIN